MNVGYEEMNCADLARALKLDKTSVALWCRQGKIIFQDVSEAGSQRKRYLIPAYEAEYIMGLFKKYGKRNAMKHYATDRPLRDDLEAKQILTKLADDTPVAQSESKPMTDDDKLLNSIIYIREVKERIEDCKAELAQLENEYRELKEEIVNQL